VGANIFDVGAHNEKRLLPAHFLLPYHPHTRHSAISFRFKMEWNRFLPIAMPEKNRPVLKNCQRPNKTRFGVRTMKVSSWVNSAVLRAFWRVLGHSLNREAAGQRKVRLVYLKVVGSGSVF
jgi:hypothetical protein